MRRDLILTGRAKNTIVLTNGKNIEPQPIEDAAIVLDGALIVLSVEALEKWASTQELKLCIQKDNVTLAGSQKINLESKIILDLFRREINHSVQNRPGVPSGRPYRHLHG